MKRKNVLSIVGIAITILLTTSVFAFSWESQKTSIQKIGNGSQVGVKENEVVITNDGVTDSYVNDIGVAGISVYLSEMENIDFDIFNTSEKLNGDRKDVKKLNEPNVIPDTKEKREPKYKISDDDRKILYRIVEAECTGQDKNSKKNVAIVILNRVEDDYFPSTIKEVVFQKINGYYQFSPISDKRYYSVDITDETKEAIDDLIRNGIEDELMEEATYFLNKRDVKNKKIIKWISNKLKYLTKDDSGHSFYKERR